MKRLSTWIVAVAVVALFSGCAGMLKMPATVSTESIEAQVSLNDIPEKHDTVIYLRVSEKGFCNLVAKNDIHVDDYPLPNKDRLALISYFDKALEWGDIAKREKIELPDGKKIGNMSWGIASFPGNQNLNVRFFVDRKNQSEVRLWIWHFEKKKFKPLSEVVGAYYYLSMENMARLKAMLESVPEYATKAKNNAVRASKLQ